ncbi:KR domain-containing protein [Pseudomassariella vexata]|uniref:KR domain-containing protein n=1 Tax=Pseudomassariella vexata TaxID=1141098 RepID=A0A1Y2DHM3_9PEZI|nr:KR domain-containing protein [Pseudomassariella vexata]ORY58730.1 KR domain-containing protein [Pseudomassariella vexata]
MAPYMASKSAPIVEDVGGSRAGINTNDRQHQFEPIAICGMALRLPGGISTPSQLWDIILNKKDARAPVPSNRYNISSYYSASGKPGHVKSEYGYFLDPSVDISALDTSFFSLPKSEIERLDPQQRLLLELTHECFESAGEPDYRGKPIGCYVGSFGQDWTEAFAKDAQANGMYTVTGYGDFVLSNRVSYEYDLKGPSMTIRTACSSALIALHEACLAIQNNECEGAVVAGTNIIMAPGLSIALSEQGVLSPNGSCRTFDVDADGYARAEAVNMIYIKSLRNALRDENPIRAVIRGVSSNSDGKTTGMSLPSSDMHESMIRKAYAAADIANISDTGFVECHGTGTPAGDPIETEAVGNVFGEKGVYIGSIKPNVGHSEGASGITSLLKCVLALENEIIPPNIKFERPNPKIKFEQKKLKVPIEAMAWPAGKAQVASVNSFGIGGSNAHVVLESTKSFFSRRDFADLMQKKEFIQNDAPNTSRESAPSLLVFSATTAESLRRRVVNTQQYLELHPESQKDLAYTLGSRRLHMPHRAFSVVGKGITPNTSPFHKAPAGNPGLVMVFTGQGAQWPQMGLELIGHDEIFTQTLQQLEKILATLPDPPPWSIVEELQKSAEHSHINEPSYSQPLCTSIQIALVDALARLGIKPTAVVGHSSGEIAAAYATGRLTISEAIIAAYYRGVTSEKIKRSGKMAAIGLGADELRPLLAPGTVIACENSPSSTTISGDIEGVEAVLKTVREILPAVFTRMLKVDRAYHSHHMQEVGESYEMLTAKHIAQGTEHSNRVAFFSTVTGTKLLDTEQLDASYWRSNLESPVLFNTAVNKLVSRNGGKNLVFLEVGPHSALAGPLRQILSQGMLNSTYASCLTRSRRADETFLSAIGQLHLQNVKIDFNRLNNASAGAKVLANLPTYPWQHDHSVIWDTRLTKEWRFRKFKKHELLGVRVAESTDNEPAWRNMLALEHVPWIRDHNIKGDVVYPCAAYIGMIGEAVRQLCSAPFTGLSLRKVVIDTALVMVKPQSVEIITSLRKSRLTDSLESSWYDFVVSSHNGASWTKHCTGQVSSLFQIDGNSTTETIPSLPRKVDSQRWYQAMRVFGANYGPSFQGLEDIACATTANEATGRAANTVQDPEEYYPIHPSKIDNFLQLCSAAACKGSGHKITHMTVPTYIEHLDIRDCETEVDMVVTAESTPRGAIYGSGKGFSSDRNLVLDVSGVKLSPLDNGEFNEYSDLHAGARTFWQPDIDFLPLSTFIKPNEDQAKMLGLLQEFFEYFVSEASRRLAHAETKLPHLEKFRSWLTRQPKPKVHDKMYELQVTLGRSALNPLSIALPKICDFIEPIFTGHVEPLDILMRDDTLTKIYDCLNMTDRSRMIQLLVHEKSNMRILEIGAGTGGTTNSFLQSVRHMPSKQMLYSSYTYTDVSAGFFAAAQERFKDFPNLNFQTLDISKDPLDQGFEPESFDLVIAANVLHATPSLRETLSRVRKLVHPQGRLYMEELCCEVKAINFIMGVLPGWWLGEEDGRHDEPYVSPERWDAELKAAGFQGLEKLALDCERPNHLLAYMISRPDSGIIPANVVTLVHDSASFEVAWQLQEHLKQKVRAVELHDLHDGIPSHDSDMIACIDLKTSYLHNIDEKAYILFQQLISQRADSQGGLLWLTRSSQMRCEDPRWAQIIGTARTIRGELGVDIATCELDVIDDATLKLVPEVFKKFQRQRQTPASQPEYEYAIVDGQVHIGRIYPVKVADELVSVTEAEGNSTSIVRLSIQKYGRLDTLKWTPARKEPLIGDIVEVETKAVGMNFKDILIAMGIVDSSVSTLGLEASGIIHALGPDVTDLKVSDRVFIFSNGCFSSQIRISAQLCIKIPDELSFEDAATMPCVFSTVIYGMQYVGRLRKGQTVLIHSGCGGIGLAAIQIAKMVGAGEIFTTVGSEEKAAYLVAKCGIPRNHIFNSRDSTFAADVKRATCGKGVDLVLNSLSGQLLHASWDCVAEFGTMIEIGKRDLIGNGQLALNPFELNRGYHGIDLGHLVESRPQEAGDLLRTIVEYYEKGLIQPIKPVTTFEPGQIADCFRYMQKGQHIGKIVVPMSDTIQDHLMQKSGDPRTVKFNPKGSYLLVGGLGGIGREVSSWMVEHGARHLIFLSSSAGTSLEDKTFFIELESQGCSVTPVRGNVCNPSDVSRAISAVPKPIKGVLNLSMVLRDQIFINMSHQSWCEAVDPKVDGTWNLHKACLKESLDLDFFVLFSSITGTIGRKGQANYAGANTFLDAFVQYRHHIGLPAGVVDIGMMLDHGYVADNPHILDRLTAEGGYGVRIPQLLDCLKLAITMGTPRKNSTALDAFVEPSQIVLGLRSLTPLDHPYNRQMWKNDRRMAVYHNSNISSRVLRTASTSSQLSSLLADATVNPEILSQASTAVILAKEIARHLFELLLRPISDDRELDVACSLQDVGLDSLVAMEMRSWWKSTLGTDISVLEMMGMGSLLMLGEHAAKGLREKYQQQEEEEAGKYSTADLIRTKMP